MLPRQVSKEHKSFLRDADAQREWNWVSLIDQHGKNSSERSTNTS